MRFQVGYAVSDLGLTLTVRLRLPLYLLLSWDDIKMLVITLSLCLRFPSKNSERVQLFLAAFQFTVIYLFAPISSYSYIFIRTYKSEHLASVKIRTEDELQIFHLVPHQRVILYIYIYIYVCV